MQKKSSPALLAFAVALAGPALAEDPGGMYLGSGLQPSAARYSLAGPQAWPDDPDASQRLFAGWQYGRRFAVEGGMVRFGRPSDAPTPLALPGERGRGWDLLAIGAIPVTEQFGLFGKFRALYPDATLATVAGGGAADRRPELNYGIGMRYEVTPRMGLRGEWERVRSGFEGQGLRVDSDVVSAGVYWQF